ncbi:hypothetical protein H8K20_11665 [Neobittarella massiliensis]|uniref:Cell division protein FtsL n=1 Tax=Neobittarella massiliensis (ex Bilen et al. 2018) TaxID=2041842 RepID=A0A8J6M233_9FIRM|nr:hypothetical protein [Neobittarella massiliensis]MBC3517051.1 hypothetical protein [Neobittarella massiliensis]
MKNAGQAYDLSLFENREPKMRVIKNEKPQPKKKGAPAGKVLLAAIAICVTGLMIYSRVVLTELGDQLSTAKDNLATLTSTTKQLDMQLETRMSLKNVEQYASTQLGLVRVDSKQVEYVDLEQQNKIEVSEEKSPVASFFGGLAAKIKEYLGL